MHQIKRLGHLAMIHAARKLLPDVRQEPAAERDVQQLMAAANRQHRLALLKNFRNQNQFALVSSAVIRRDGDGLANIFRQRPIVKLGVNVIAAREQNPVGAPHGFSQQRAVGRHRRDQRNAAGRQNGRLVTHRQADREVAEFEAALLDARRNKNQWWPAHAKNVSH